MAATPESTGPNLTIVTYFGRQAVKFGAIGLVTLMVGRMVFSAAWTYWRVINPPPPPPPTVGFGVLPAIEFPEEDSEGSPTAYALETATGTLPNFGDRAKVLLKEQAVPGLLNDQEAKELAADMGFVFAPQVLGVNTYRFTRSEPIDSRLEMDIITKNFELTTDFANRPELLADNPLPDQLQANSTLRNLLSGANLLQRDLATASADVQYLTVTAAGTEPAVSISDADVIELSLRRTPIDSQFEIVTPGRNKGNIYALLIGSLSGFDSIVALDYNYQPVDYSQVHTYPLRTSQSAWQLLQAGEGFVAKRGEFDTATIRSVRLGYFDSFEQSAYLQPVYVFEGDGGFLGYVPAVDPRFIQSAEQ